MLKKGYGTVFLLILFSSGFAAVLEGSRDTFKKPATAAGSDLYQKGLAAVKANDYAKALPLFTQASQAEKDNPDILNMLAYTQRKLGKTQEALNNYHRALELRPNFPQAREYLGEAYLQAALQELETLKRAGAEGKKQANLLGQALVDAAGKVGPLPQKAEAAAKTQW